MPFLSPILTEVLGSASSLASTVSATSGNEIWSTTSPYNSTIAYMSTSSKKPVVMTLSPYNGYFSQILSYLSLSLSESVVVEWSSSTATTSRVSSTITVPSDFSDSSHTLSHLQAASTKSDIRFETSMFSSVVTGDRIRTRTPSMTRIIQCAGIRQVSPSTAAEAQTQPTLPAQKRDETLSRGSFPTTPSPIDLPAGSPFSFSSRLLQHPLARQLAGVVVGAGA